MRADLPRKHVLFLKVLVLAFVVGLAIAAVLCVTWRRDPAVFSSQLRVAAVAICPPFLLAGVLEATADSTLAVVMTIGTIVFANGFLYAGLASFAYFLATVFLSKRRA
jgi:hypothetical protein